MSINGIFRRVRSVQVQFRSVQTIISRRLHVQGGPKS